MLWQKVIGATSGGSVIKYVGGRVNGYSGTLNNITVPLTGLTGGLGTQPAAGDLVIVYVATGSSGDGNLSVFGYTEILELFSDGSSADTNFAIARKFMSATPDTTVTFGGTGSSGNAGTVAIQVWRNVNVTTPFDVAGLSSTKTGATATFPSITPTTPGAVILAGAAAGHTNGSITYSNSSLTGFISIGSNDTYDSTIGVGYHYWTSGSFTPADSVFGGTDSSTYSSASYIMALRPAL